MPTVSVSRNGFALDGQPFFLLSGCVHYFRYPKAEWRGLLEDAKAAGLNTIDTVIPWNRHEPQPGVFDFAEEADIAAYLDLCAELGLYAIVRPGPYICAEWENGGFPAWLSGRESIELRVDNPIYLEATLRWFDTLFPILAPRQINHGGPIILCQIENEHWASGRYGSDTHQDTLAQAAIARGMVVPQYTCMGASPDWPEFRNGWSGIAEKLQQTRALWQENPMIVSELWSGWFDNWGASHNSRKTAARLDQILHQLTAVGCSGFSHWMWAGGTNFGYWGGRTVGGDTIHMTTSYDYDAPVTEYGEHTAKYHVARRHHMFLSTLGAQLSAVLADGVPGGPTVIAPAAVKGRSEGGSGPYRQVKAGPNAPVAWRDFTATFLQNPSFEGQVHQVFLKNPVRHLAVEVEAGSIKPIFTNMPLFQTGDGRRETGDVWLNYHSGRLLGFWQEDGRDTLVVYGFAGEQGELALSVPGGTWGTNDAPATVQCSLDGATCTLRYWITEKPTTVHLVANGRELILLLLTTEQASQFQIEHFRAQHVASLTRESITRQPTIYNLQSTICNVAEASATDGWQVIEKPLPLEHLGCDLGYGWYRAELTLDAPHETTLVAPGLSDRARLLVDGVDAGVFGVTMDGPIYTLPLKLAAGNHELRLLADNLGRFNYGSNTGERKGLLDTLYWGGVQHDISTGWVALWQEAVFAGEAIADAKPWAVRPDISNVDLGNFPFQGPSVWLLRAFEGQAGHNYLIHLTGDRNPGALYINGVNVERFSRHRSGGVIKRDISHVVRPGTNVIALNITDYAGIAWRATLLEYDPTRALAAQWSFRPGVSPNLTAEHAEGTKRMAFYRAAFPISDLKSPISKLALRIGGLCKGQIWLNGRNVGRYWHVGPQESYKLPVSWLQDENELLIFDEEGGSPQGLALVF
ncbi:MAG: beta-galactosidase [Chloroflexaceae bacterium]|jgi:hypothetical protein|nr:beta-galactosidase [Chloroflexaceae bacterium]